MTHTFFIPFCLQPFRLTLISVLTEKDHLKIHRLLRTLEESDIVLLGQALGLLRSKLKRLKKCPDEMIDAWLRQEDDVLESSGPPTWESLCKALREINQNGIAIQIFRYASPYVEFYKKFPLSLL